MQKFTYMSSFSALGKAGVGLGAIKGMIGQPDTMEVDPRTGQVINKKYNPLERGFNIAVNGAVGGILGEGANAAGLGDPIRRQQLMDKLLDSRLGQQGKGYMEQAKRYIPEIEIIR